MILFHRRFSPVQFSEAKIKGFFTYLPIFLLFPNVKAKNFTKFRICLLLFCVLLAFFFVKNKIVYIFAKNLQKREIVEIK